MIPLPSSVRVHLAAEPIDLRRGHDGLVGLVRNTWNDRVGCVAWARYAGRMPEPGFGAQVDP